MSDEPKQLGLYGHDRAYIREMVELEDGVALGESLDIKRDTEPEETLTLGDSTSLEVEVYEGDTISLSESLTATDAAPESRVGYARVGFSEVAA